MPHNDNGNEQDELCLFLFSLLGLPNRPDLPENTPFPTKRRNGAGLAEELEYTEGQISRLLTKKRDWTDDALNRALKFINRKMEISSTAVSHDLLLNPVARAQRLFSNTEKEHEFLVRTNGIQSVNVPFDSQPTRLTKDHLRLIGFWASVFLCIDPKQKYITRHAVAVVGFEIYQYNDTELAIKETNYEFEDLKEIVPEGRVRIVDGIIECDIGYISNVDPIAKYLGYLPANDPHGRSAFIASLLDVKLKSRLVVARPTMFLKLKKAVEKFDTYPEGSALYSAASTFFGKHAQFAGTSFELCPTRDPPWQDWSPVFEAVEDVVGPVDYAYE